MAAGQIGIQEMYAWLAYVRCADKVHVPNNAMDLVTFQDQVQAPRNVTQWRTQVVRLCGVSPRDAAAIGPVQAIYDYIRQHSPAHTGFQ